MDEEYFVHTLLPFARGTFAGNASIRKSLRSYHSGANVPLMNMVLKEFRREVGGVLLPSNRIAKLIDAPRFRGVLYKIIRGLHFHHTGEILPTSWDISFTVTAPREAPPDFFLAITEAGMLRKNGNYPGVFDYCFWKFSDVHDLHVWAFLLWDAIIITAVFHDVNCECEHCSFIGPLLPEDMEGTIRA